MQSPSLPSILSQNVWMIPYLLVYLFGLVYAIINMSRCSGAAILTMAAISIMLIMMVGGSLLTSAIIASGDHGDYENLGMVLQAIGLIRSLGAAMGTAMLIFAVFMGRTEPVHAAMQNKPPM